MSGNGSRLYRLGKIVPPGDNETERAKVFAAFSAIFDRLPGDDRALVRERSRHERAVGITPDTFSRILREAFVGLYGFGYEERGGEMVRIRRAARPPDAFLADVMRETHAWKANHPERCVSCAAEMASTRGRGWDRANA
jgi:hypothetical protein